MDFLDQYGIQMFAESSDDDETFLVSNPKKILFTLDETINILNCKHMLQLYIQSYKLRVTFEKI